jgi:hypothetical protein
MVLSKGRLAVSVFEIYKFRSPTAQCNPELPSVALNDSETLIARARYWR